MECSDASTSTSSICTMSARQACDKNIGASQVPRELSHSPSPRSSSLPSPTDSPPDSISSLPSIGSSFFFSSAAASPPHSHAHSEHAKDTTQGLIIPSLTLPEPLPQPTQYGKTLGDIRLLIIWDGEEDRDIVSSLLLDDNDDVVDHGIWEDTGEGSVLLASTDWIEHRDPHGLEKFEPARNVEIVARRKAHASCSTLLSLIHTPFHSLLGMIAPHCQPSAALTSFIASPSTPIYTALIVLSKSAPSLAENDLIDALTPHVPVIVLRYGLDQTRFPPRPHMSSFCPTSASALRHGLFRSPETLSSLRYEAAERFLHWREVERAVESIRAAHRETAIHLSEKQPSWDKEKWEAEWESRLSHDVATRSREDTITIRPIDTVRQPPPPVIDPLHFSSLVSFSFSLFGPAKARIRHSLSKFTQKLSDNQVRIALVGSFCVGIGVGWILSNGSGTGV
ncbi:hypothetical protein ID866_2073 [Astraeus odoratus]|nr:hypothetical protein ID866_2073 [Astraeus odoratus]